MKKCASFLFAFLAAATFALAATDILAANYSVTATWTDSTVVQPGYTYTPNYDVEYRVAAGASTPVNGLGSTTWAGTITANPGDTIEVRVRALNIAPNPDLVGTWSVWASAVAPTPYSAPGAPSTPILIVIPQ
jgi:hypothetical protein